MMVPVLSAYDGIQFKLDHSGQLLLLQNVSFSMFDQMEPSQKPSQAEQPATSKQQPVQLPTTTTTAIDKRYDSVRQRSQQMRVTIERCQQQQQIVARAGGGAA